MGFYKNNIKLLGTRQAVTDMLKIHDQTRVIQLTILLYIKINAENVDSENSAWGDKVP